VTAALFVIGVLCVVIMLLGVEGLALCRAAAKPAPRPKDQGQEGGGES
jgi:hypothetical protein